MDFKEQFGHGGNVYAKLAESGGKLADILDFSANINPFGLAPKVRQAIVDAVDDIVHYPDPAGRELKKAVSCYYHLPPEFITLGNGASELIYLLCQVLKPRRAFLPAPTFSEYARAAQIAGAEIRYFYLTPAENFLLDPAEFIPAMGQGEITFICNPNNPTGTILTAAEISPILEQAAAQNGIVVVDESFLDFLPDSAPYTCKPLLHKYNNLIILHSLTKFFALPGLRLGFALASPAITSLLHEAKDVWNVNTLAQKAGVCALADFDYQNRSRSLVNRAKAALYEKLRSVPGFKPYPPSVNYIFLNIEASGFTAAELSLKMAAQNILIRDCANYPGLSPSYIRLAVKLPEQNGILISALHAVLGKKEN
ncbi:MAG: threonine-phosphate decarboxylase CobD [Sporomusaceae bacterium]|jgi:threonine-phosphate decarboxylase|nr:threonine-phosphate decarboxylase CobD [Sporomusaceae bacterium]